MGKKLLIVESPAKAKTINRYLGDDYMIAASVGHVRDLPSMSLGVDVRHDFKPRYINMRGKEKVIKDLKAKAEQADCIYIATDPDREGEAIGWHLEKLLNLDETEPVRITFNEITKNAIQKAVTEPRTIDINLVNAQQARRILDRLVGYELSPVLWQKIRKGLSAGRVQSVATKIIVDREREIKAFVPEEYWLLNAEFAKANSQAFAAEFYGRLQAGKISKVELKNEIQAKGIYEQIKGQQAVVKELKKGERKRSAAPPYTTSTLQQEASWRLGFGSSRTMKIAQQLYEGVEIQGLGQISLISYIRTDSVRISEEALKVARELISKKFGEAALPAKPNYYKNKGASQDAHEAIRPTHFELEPEFVKHSLTNEQYQLYKLIFQKFLASQMCPAVFSTQKLDILVADEFVFKAKGERLLKPGFLAAFNSRSWEENQKEGMQDNLLPELTVGEKLESKKLRLEQKFTSPPKRYTEASLIKLMEEQGIGRPSTYAPTIKTIIERAYVEKVERSLQPTELGIIVTEFLEANFPKIVNVSFTKAMEDDLDLVEAGKKDYPTVLHEFYEPFSKDIKNVKENIAKVELAVSKTGEKCPECKEGDLVYKEGRFGKFIACERFPECKYTHNAYTKTEAICPLCGSPIIAMRSHKRKKIFYVCDKSKQADCAFISWNLPLAEKCEICGAYKEERIFRRQKSIICSNEECPSRVKKTDKTKQTETDNEVEKEPKAKKTTKAKKATKTRKADTVESENTADSAKTSKTKNLKKAAKKSASSK